MNTVTGALSIIENMGSEKYLYFTVNNKEFIAKVNDQSITTADIGKICISTLIQASVIYLIFTLKKI